MIHASILRGGFDLPGHLKAQGRIRRKRIILRPIQPTNAQAQSLALIMVKVAAFWSAAIPRILAQYDPPALPVARDSIFGLGDVLDGLRDEFERLVLTLIPGLQDFAVRTEAWHRDRWTSNLMTATGVQLETMLSAGDVQEPIAAFVQRNAALIRDISDEARGRISDIVLRGYQQRAPIVDVAKQVREAVDMSRRRAIRVAGDQTQKLSTALDTERMVQAGLKRWQWLHSGKRHPRSWHLARNGHIYSWEDQPPAGDRPGEAPFCGCRKLGVIDLED